MSHSTFGGPSGVRYFEDYKAGSVYEFGSIGVDEAEVIEFARRFDPQVFHSDPEAAKKTIFGGLIASGRITDREELNFLDGKLREIEDRLNKPDRDKR